MDRVKILQDTPHKEKNGIFVVNVPTAVSANKTVRKILDNYTDSKTALFLSGGNTPKKLYEDIASEKALKVGSVLQVDERFGERLHRHSNELMIKNTGLLEYFDEQNIRFYGILKDKEIGETAEDYDETLRFVFKYFPKSVGIMGIGSDGHTAGIPAILSISKQILEDQSSLATFYDDSMYDISIYHTAIKYGSRITMTFRALEMLDLILILVLGQEKREALRLIFADPSASVRQAQDKGSGQAAVEEVPARFYLKPEIAAKTILVTDQIV